MINYWFSTARGVLRHGDARVARVGETHTVTGPLKMCERGLHSSARIIDALHCAPGCRLWRVEIGDDAITEGDKSVSSSREYLATCDAMEVLGEFARTCADRARQHAADASAAAASADDADSAAAAGSAVYWAGAARSATAWASARAADARVVDAWAAAARSADAWAAAAASAAYWAGAPSANDGWASAAAARTAEGQWQEAWLCEHLERLL